MNFVEHGKIQTQLKTDHFVVITPAAEYQLLPLTSFAWLVIGSELINTDILSQQNQTVHCHNVNKLVTLAVASTKKWLLVTYM